MNSSLSIQNFQTVFKFRIPLCFVLQQCMAKLPFPWSFIWIDKKDQKENKSLIIKVNKVTDYRSCSNVKSGSSEANWKKEPDGHKTVSFFRISKLPYLWIYSHFQHDPTLSQSATSGSQRGDRLKAAIATPAGTTSSVLFFQSSPKLFSEPLLRIYKLHLPSSYSKNTTSSTNSLTILKKTVQAIPMSNPEPSLIFSETPLCQIF